MFETLLSDVDNRYPEIAKLVGRGSLFCMSDNKGLFAQRNSKNRIRVYVALRVEQTWPTDSGISFDQTEQARNHLLQLFADWDNNLLNLIRFGESNFIPRPLYMLPVDHQWKTQSGVTLLGDAAHLMTPFAGEGANLAMLDAAELALAIVDCKDLDQAIHQYEQKMYIRSNAAATETFQNLNLFMAPGNTGKVVGDYFTSFIARLTQNNNAQANAEIIDK